MLPPFVPGHEPHCPYTLNPTNADVWRAPDMRKALALIAASGTRGTPITIWNQPGFFTDSQRRHATWCRCLTGSATQRGSKRSPSPTLRSCLAWRIRGPALRPTSTPGARVTLPRRSSSGPNSGVVKASFPIRRATTTWGSSAIRNSMPLSAVHSPPKPPDRLPLHGCGPKRTGSSPIRPRWCPCHAEPNRPRLTPRRRLPVRRLCGCAARPTLGALAPPDRTSRPTGLCRPPRSPRKSLSWREPGAPEMHQLRERFFAMLGRPD